MAKPKLTLECEHCGERKTWRGDAVQDLVTAARESGWEMSPTQQGDGSYLAVCPATTLRDRIEKLVGEVYEIGHAHGMNHALLPLNHPGYVAQRVNDGWEPLLDAIVKLIGDEFRFDAEVRLAGRLFDRRCRCSSGKTCSVHPQCLSVPHEHEVNR